ncbi:hypothetical protein [Shewanella algae]|uniref:hypothetical protein n=1 Tax=Shewanella algae TaxID=38313 RepID=UPI00313E2892
MHHCNQPIYAKENFCGHCGESLPEQPKLKNIEDVAPEILKDLKPHYSGARTFTGRVNSSFLYKRRRVDSGNNLTYSYWWLELEDKDGNIERVSVNAENKFYDQLRRGDVLTLFYPTDYTLNYRIEGKDAKRLVSHNHMAPAAISHEADGQRSTIVPDYEPGSQSSAFWWLLLGIASALLLYFGAKQPTEIAIGVAVVLSVVCFILERQRNQKKHTRELRRYEALQLAMKRLLSVTQEALGYHIAQRPRKDSDIFCFKCQSRIDGEHGYCVQCGSSQQQAPATAANSLSVRDEEEAMMRQYSLSYREPYLHKHVLAGDEKGEVSVSCIMGKVLDRSASASVDDFTVTTTKTTTTDHYVGNRFSHSTTDTETSSHRSRSSNVDGEVLLQLADGEVREMHFGEDLLGDLDVGDWMIYASSRAKLGVDDYNREYAYNLTKSKRYNNTSFQQYGKLNGAGTWILLAIAALVFNFWGPDHIWYQLFDMLYFPLLDPIYSTSFFRHNLTLVVFIMVSAVLLVWTLLYGRRNQERKRKLLSRLTDHIDGFTRAIPELKEKLKRMG